jgi:iron complex transport system substrate-binding protein
MDFMIKFEKIISLLPSATEILFELGLDDRLKGVTHECNYPTQALNKPKIIQPSFDVKKLDSTDIDKKIKEMSFNGQPIFTLNSAKIKDIKPDLIISQDICWVCAPFKREIQQIYSFLDYSPRNISLNPENITDILNSITMIGKEVGNLGKSLEIVQELTKRIGLIEQKIKSSNLVNRIKKQKIICLEWVSPFYVAGHWIPEMVEIAGGINGVAKKGDSSRMISIDEIMDFDPDKIIFMPCGFDIDRTKTEVMALSGVKNWDSLRAVRMNEIFVVDASSYFSKPGPRIIIGLEVLAKIIHPDLFDGLRVPSRSYIRIENS